MSSRSVLVSAPTDGCAAGAQARPIRGSSPPLRRNTIVAGWTALRLAGTVLHGLAQIVMLFPWLSTPQRDMRVQTWARTVLKQLGVELRVGGNPVRVGPMLLVSNHISWLDIVALHAVCHCRFVSKADVRRWPLIGTLATGGRTLYIERESRFAAVRMVHLMVQALRDGEILAVFPEGTTGDGSSVLPFHSNLIQAAILADAPVQTIALQFVDGRSGIPSQAVRYMRDESLVGSIWRTLSARDLCAAVVFGAPQRADGRDRRAWARELRREIMAMRQA
jgi:1-acyl-sn-glycerol-3-phosphate acyltransferase